MKRVAFMVNSTNWSSSELDLYELLIRWDRSPAPIVYMVEDGILGNKLREHGITVRLIPTHEFQDTSMKHARARFSWMDVMAPLRYIRKLSQAFKSDGIECVHLYSISSKIYGTIAAKWVHLPVVWCVHKSIALPYMNVISSMILRYCYRYIPNGIMVNSRATLVSLKLPLKKESKVQVIYPSYRGVYGRREGLAPKPECITVLLVGKFSEWKTKQILLEAAKAFLPDKHIRFWIVSHEQDEDTSYRDMLQQYIQLHGLRNLMVFEYVENIVDILHQADILLDISISAEPIHQVIVQAMAAGIPIIATNIGGAREIILDEETGLLVSPEDVGALRRSIRRLVNNPDERIAMGQRGMARVQNHFTIELSIQRFMDYYR